MSRSPFALVIGLLFCSVPFAADAENTEQGETLADRATEIERQLELLKSSGDAESARALVRKLDDVFNEIEDQLRPMERYQKRRQAKKQVIVGQIEHQLSKLSPSSRQLVFKAREQLDRLTESWKDGSYYLRPSEELLVQWVHVEKGRQGDVQFPRQELGDPKQIVEIDLQLTERPTVLVLTSPKPTRWKLKTHSKSDLRAVIATGSQIFHAVEGAGDALIFHRHRFVRGFDSWGSVVTPNFIGQQVGREVDVELKLQTAEEPIELGTSSEEWVRAYVAAQLEHLRNDLQSRLNSEFAAMHGKLRFSSIATDIDEHGRRTTAVAEFSLKGPDLSTLRPTPMAIWNHVQTKAGDRFGLTHAGWLKQHAPERKNRFDRRNTSTWITVNDPPGYQSDLQFRSLAYYVKRDRLLLLDREDRLFAYEYGKKLWHHLANSPGLVAIGYNANTDAIVGVRQLDAAGLDNNFAKRVSLVTYDQNGRELREVETNCRIPIQDEYDRAGNEISFAPGYLIAMQPTSGNAHRNPANTMLRVFDLKTGELRYNFAVPPISGERYAYEKRRYPEPGDDTTFWMLQERYRTAEKAIDDYRGSQEKLHALKRRLERLASPVERCKSSHEAPNVHLVHTYSDRSPLVTVTDKSGPLIVGITAFDQPDWRFNISDGVDLKQLIVVCYGPPEILGLPEGVKVVYNTTDDRTELENVNCRQLSFVTSMVEKLAKHKVTTRTDATGRAKKEILIGPENADWVVGRSLRLLDRLISDAHQDSDSTVVQRLAEFRFPGVYYGTLPGVGDGKPARYLAEYTIKGPIAQTCRPLIDFEPLALARVSERTLICGTSARELKQLQLSDAGISEELIESAAEARGSLALSFDATTKRLFHVSTGGLHVRQNGSWSTLTKPQGNYVGWAYAADRKCFFAPVMGRKAVTHVDQITERGATVRRNKLPVPIPKADRFMAYHDGHLILMHNDRQNANNSRMLVLDANDFASRYEGRLRPYIEHESLPAEKFEQLWDRLAEASDAEADATMWGIAAGLDDSVERIRFTLGVDELAKQPQISAALVKRNIERLDADKFAERDAAFQELTRSARGHIKLLEAALENPKSAEQRQRLQRVIAAWETRDQRLATADRRGMQILARINSEDSRAVLQDMADGIGSLSAKEEATRLLKLWPKPAE